MYRIFLLIVPLFMIQCAGESTEEQYRIGGTVTHFEPGDRVVLSHFNPVSQQKTGLDTASIADDGSYEIRYEFAGPDLFRLDFPGRQHAMLTIDQGQTDIRVDAEGKRNGAIQIAGSPDSEKLLGYDAFRAESNKRLISPAYTAMREAREAGDVETEVAAVEAYVKASKQHRKELIDYTEKEIGTSIALYGTMLRWTGDDEVERLETLVQAFAEKFPDLPATQAMQEKVERYKRVAIGAEAPPLVAATPSGDTLSLSDIDAKYVLIDFWASWCSPCISQVPDLIQVYEAFNDDGFEILSVSLDSREDRWKEAIDNHALDWLHISDVRGWQSALGQAYNVTFIPFNLLIDEKGIIVAKNLHSKELYNTVKRLMAKA